MYIVACTYMYIGSIIKYYNYAIISVWKHTHTHTHTHNHSQMTTIILAAHVQSVNKLRLS